MMNKNVLKRLFCTNNSSNNTKNNPGKITIIKANPNDFKNFGTRFSEDEIQKYMDPFGFLNPEEEQHSIESKESLKQKNVDKNKETKILNKPLDKPMPKEYGMKPRGKEPTRYGDWEIKGKCVDF